MKIFLSYAHEDRPQAERLAIALRQESHDVFFDRDDLPPGEGYHRTIREAVQGCELFIFLVSSNSIDANSYTLTELQTMRERAPDPSGVVLPVMVGRTDYKDIPPYLSAVNVLEPKGDMVADVLRAIARSNGGDGGRRRSKLRYVLATGALVALLALGYFIFNPAPVVIGSDCVLTARIRMLAETARLDDLVMDATTNGVTRSARVATDGAVSFTLGDLTSSNNTSRLELRDVDGHVIGSGSLTGCPGKPETLELGNGIRLEINTST
jgi:hypothetical protein